MPVPVFKSELDLKLPDELLSINGELLADFLVAFLQDECIRRRRMEKVVIGLSGGVDSAVTTYLAARAFGPKNVFTFRLPYKISSNESLTHAQLVVDDLGVQDATIPITNMVDGYVLASEPDMSPTRLGNVCARCRMTILYDQSAEIGGLTLGTGNKTERFFGYYTWHADDAPAINPLGDLYKTQVWDLARTLGVPSEIVDKPPTADLVKGQTDEGDFGISYVKADRILSLLLYGFDSERVMTYGFTKDEVALVEKRVGSTHWKRKLPTTAMISNTAINEFYLRPVDY